LLILIKILGIVLTAVPRPGWRTRYM